MPYWPQVLNLVMVLLCSITAGWAMYEGRDALAIINGVVAMGNGVTFFILRHIRRERRKHGL